MANLSALVDFAALVSGSKLVLTVAELAGVADSSVTFGVRLTNFLGFETYESVAARIAVVGEPIPSVVVTGGTNLQVLRPQALSVFAQASVSACEGQTTSTAKLFYTWRLLELPSIASTSVDPRQFRLAPDTLEASTHYTLQVTVADVLGRNNSAQISVDVGSSEIVALLDDALLSNAEFVVGAAELFSLDASGSYDPDRQGTDKKGTEKNTNNLAFEWWCFDGNGDDSVDNNCGLSSPLGASSSVQVNASALSPLGTYRFVVRVSDVLDASRSATASASTFVSAVAAVPSVKLGLRTPVVKINPSSELTLVGAVSSSEASQLALEWSVAGELSAPYLTLEDSALTPISSSIVANTAFYTPKYLKLSANALAPGSAYSFRLGAVSYDHDSNVVEGYAMLKVKVNSAPTSGLLRVEPESGYTLQTGFALSALNWVDDAEDLPFTYSFYSSPDGVEQYQLKVSASASYSPALLPAGELDGFLVVLCYISDTHGATATASNDQVQVLVEEMSVSELANLTSSILVAAFDSGDTERVFAVLNSVGNLLIDSVGNLLALAPNCSSDCASFGRHKCNLADLGSCGECLTGLSGALAPSIRPCRELGEDCGVGECGGENCPACGVGSPCSTGDDCVYGLCDASFVCAAPFKKCGSDCSSSGLCEFVDTSNANALVARCGLDDAWCVARCVCEDGYYGSMCEYNAESYDAILDLTATLVDSLAEAASQQDADASAGNQASASLALVTKFPCALLESGSIENAQATTLALASSASKAGMIGNTVQSLVSSLSSFVAADACSVSPRRRKRERRFSSDATDEASATAAMLGSATDDITVGMLLSAVPGEAPATVLSDNVVLAGRRIAPEEAFGASLTAPLTTAQLALGVQPAVMAMPIVNISLNGTVALDMQLVQYCANPFPPTSANSSRNLSFTTPPIRSAVYGLSREPDGMTDRRRLAKKSGGGSSGGGGVSDVMQIGAGTSGPLGLGFVDPDGSFVFTLRRERPLSKANREVTQLVLVCPPEFVGSVNGTCPGSSQALVLDCKGALVEQVVNINCTTILVDACLTFDHIGDFWESQKCFADLERSNDSNVTCVCLINPGGGVDVAASAEALTESFINEAVSFYSPLCMLGRFL